MNILDKLGVRRRTVPTSSEESSMAIAGGIYNAELGGFEPDPYETVDAASLISFVDAEYDRRLKERTDFELQWRLNLAFAEGNQYVEINQTAQTLDEVPPDNEYQQQEVFNHIAPNIETRIARLGKMRPVLTVRPGSSDRKDLRATKVSSQLLQNTYYDQKFKEKLLESIGWLEYCGTVVIKNYWNPTKGPIISVPQMAEDGVTVVGEEQVQEGDLGILVCPPQEILPDSPYTGDIELMKSIIHAKAYHKDAVKEIWGIEVAPEDSVALNLQQSMLGQGGLRTYQGLVNTRTLKDYVVVKEYWERPTAKWPKGRLIIVAGKKLLEFGPLPYYIDPDGALGLPFVKICCIKRPSVFWGKTVTERLIPLQRAYNALRNRKIEYLARCAVGQWIVQENTVDLDELEENGSKPGYILVVKQGATISPRKAENPALPAAFETEEYTLLQEFSILSGVSEISRQSKAPTGVKSGVAMSLALEQDETRLSSVAVNIEEGVIKCGAQWLRLYKQHVKVPRVLRSVGRNNIVDVYDWEGSDLKAEDVVMDTFSALSESPAQKRQMVFDLMGAGLFQNPDTGRVDRPTRSRILEMLQFTDWAGIDDSDELHISKAERENRMMAEGTPVMSADYDDHLIHVEKHNEYRLSIDFDMLISENPEVAKIFMEHVGQHLNVIMQARMAQMASAPGGGGTEVTN